MSTPAASPPCGTSSHANGASSPPRAGYSYQEIATPPTPATPPINRRITEGRDRLRKLARERDTPSDKEPEMGAENPPPAT